VPRGTGNRAVRVTAPNRAVTGGFSRGCSRINRCRG
ncbi:hypothetical protein EE612_000189, partial [Oryza sativa]